MDYGQMAQRYLFRGCCCGEALVKMGFELLGEEENERVVNAACGLCNGMHSGGECGALTGACMTLAMFGRSEAPDLCAEFYDWFDGKYGAEYGSTACVAIRGDDPHSKLERCMPMIEDCAEKCGELLEDYDLI